MQEKMIFKKDAPFSSQFLETTKSFSYLSDLTLDTVDIEFFKRSVSLHYQHLYANKKWQSALYRFIFLSLGLLFLIMAGIIFFKTTNHACGFYFSQCDLLKKGLNMFCFLLAASSFTCSYYIHPEKEAIHYLIGKVEREINVPAKHLQIEFQAIFAHLAQEWLSPHQTLRMKKIVT